MYLSFNGVLMYAHPRVHLCTLFSVECSCTLGYIEGTLMYPGFNEAGMPNLTHCACDKCIPPFSHTLVCKCNLISGFTLAACLSGRGVASGNWIAWHAYGYKVVWVGMRLQ